MTYQNLRTLRQLAAANPAFSEAALRWHVFNATSNGLDRAIIRLGRKVLIDENEFSKWLESKRTKVVA